MKCPIIIERNPYVKDERVKPETFVGQTWTPDSYVRITQHCRGYGRSEGDWIPYATERADGLAFLEWARQLPFYNGEIFLSGGSYLSSVHLLYIDTTPPDVKGTALKGSYRLLILDACYSSLDDEYRDARLLEKL